jgi:hypothetical protein
VDGRKTKEKKLYCIVYCTMLIYFSMLLSTTSIWTIVSADRTRSQTPVDALSTASERLHKECTIEKSKSSDLPAFVKPSLNVNTINDFGGRASIFRDKLFQLEHRSTDLHFQTRTHTDGVGCRRRRRRRGGGRRAYDRAAEEVALHDDDAARRRFRCAARRRRST